MTMNVARFSGSEDDTRSRHSAACYDHRGNRKVPSTRSPELEVCDDILAWQAVANGMGMPLKEGILLFRPPAIAFTDARINPY